jgi:catechol-2,3-dioxygenase
MVPIRRVGHATLSTPDLEAQVAYYMQILGFNLLHKDGDRAFFASEQGFEVIELVRGDAGRLARMSFQIDPGADLNAVAVALREESIACERRSDISPSVREAVCFTDPSGIPIDIYAEYEFPKGDGVVRAVSILKLGHIAYRVADIRKTVQFYTEIFGFRVSDWRADNFAFLRCGVDHHALNFVVDPKPQLHHIAFEVKDVAAVISAADYFAKNNVLLVWGPGRHIIGHNVAVYHRNSDKVRVELFAEMDQMKDETLGYFDPRPWHQDRPQRPKVWGPDTLRNYWGYGSERIIAGYQTSEAPDYTR